MKPFSIAIDGPAGAGKSTVAKVVAERLSAMYMDTGAMYRAIGLGVMQMGKNPSCREDVEEALPSLNLELSFQGGQRVILNGEDVTDSIRTPECSLAASGVSSVPAVRIRLVDIQRRTAMGQSVVMDGRDIGTHVLPDATLKVYLTASPEERARRRCEELCAKGIEDSFENVLADINKRDEQDMNRAVSPLRKAEDAVEVDSTDMQPEEVIDRIVALLQERTEAE